MQRVERVYYNHTKAALEDRLLIEVHSRKKYIEKAERLLYRIDVSNPLPVFGISEQDIPKGLVNSLQGLGTIIMNKVVTNVVRSFYESVDFDYYHTIGIYGIVRRGLGA